MIHIHVNDDSGYDVHTIQTNWPYVIQLTFPHILRKVQGISVFPQDYRQHQLGIKYFNSSLTHSIMFIKKSLHCTHQNTRNCFRQFTTNTLCREGLRFPWELKVGFNKHKMAWSIHCFFGNISSGKRCDKHITKE